MYLDSTAPTMWTSFRDTAVTLRKGWRQAYGQEPQVVCVTLELSCSRHCHWWPLEGLKPSRCLLCS